jgi:sulfur transfer complex TusBCD TusB component (DsrH family)
MIVRFASFHLDSTAQALLNSLATTDIIVCCGDGVYAFNTICHAYPTLSVMAMEKDCAERGVAVEAALSSDKLSALHQQHQQWINVLP